MRVDSAEYKEDLLDLLLIVDASLIGEAVRPLAAPIIDSLADGEQMAVISFDQSATLLQDFTSSKQFLHDAIAQIRYGNNPRILDALYAAIDGAFERSSARRVALVIAAGAEGESRSSLAEVLELARRRGASISIAFAQGYDSGLFEKLAGGSGGAWFNAKKLDLEPKELAQRALSVVRGHFTTSRSAGCSLSATGSRSRSSGRPSPRRSWSPRRWRWTDGIPPPTITPLARRSP